MQTSVYAVMDTRAVNVPVNGGADYRATSVPAAWKERPREQGNVIYLDVSLAVRNFQEFPGFSADLRSGPKFTADLRMERERRGSRGKIEEFETRYISSSR